MRAKEKVRFGSANVFADLEFENPEEEVIRAGLAAKVDTLLSDLEGNQRKSDSGLAFTSPRFPI